MPNYKRFVDICEAIERAISASGGSQIDLIKDVANMVYLTEILEADDLYPLHWLLDFDDSLGAKAPAETVTGITAGQPPVVSDATHTYSVGDVIAINDVVGMTELNDRMYRVGAISAGVSYSLYDLDGTAIDGTGYTAWTSGGKATHRGVQLNTTNKAVKRLLFAGWVDLNDGMDEMDFRQLESRISYWDGNTSRPMKYMHDKRFNSDYTAIDAGDEDFEIDYLLWYPGADQAYGLRYWFEKRAPRLENDNDIPLMPYQFHDAIQTGAITRLAESGIEVNTPAIWPQLYRIQLNNIRSYNRAWHDNQQREKDKPYLL